MVEHECLTRDVNIPRVYGSRRALEVGRLRCGTGGAGNNSLWFVMTVLKLKRSVGPLGGGPFFQRAAPTSLLLLAPLNSS